MIDHVDREQLDQMTERSKGPWITLHLPTERAGSNRAAKIQFKNMVRDALGRLKDRGDSHRAVEALRSRADAVLDDAPLWATADHGLAVFLAPDDQLVVRLAESCAPMMTVGNEPHVDVVRSQVESEASSDYAVLAISLKNVRLLRGNGMELAEDANAGLPSDLESALALDDREAQLQSRVTGRVGAGRVTAGFHGHESVRDADIARFMRLVDDALAAAVADETPIVLAGVDRTVTAFRKVSKHPGIVAESISGNADRTPPAELAEKAHDILHA